MAETDPNELEKIDRKIRINELKEQASELTGGKMHAMENEDTPPEIQEQFWQNVVDYEKAPWTTGHKQLEREGLVLPPPEQLTDEQIGPLLWDVIQRLARLHTFLVSTDHLSDRELYEHLWRESLNEEFPEHYTTCEDGAYFIDMVGSGSEEDIELHLKYYADDEYRQQWLADWPDDPLPSKTPRPYDRDSKLPKAPF